MNREKTGLVAKATEYALGIEFIRNIIFKKAREQVMKLSGGLYPAPLKVSFITFVIPIALKVSLNPPLTLFL